MIRLGAVVPLVFRLGAGNPTIWDVFQVPSGLCVMTPNDTPLLTRGLLQPGGVAAAIARKSAVICRATISRKPEPFMPIVFLSLVALSIVTNFPDSSTAPRVVMPSL